MNVEQLTEILGLQTQTGEETLVMSYICKRAREMGRQYRLDMAGNIYVLPLADDPFVPCVAAHTDTVHAVDEGIVIKRDEEALILYAEKDGIRTGCGGDDKAGVYIALQLLEDHPALMGAFFHGEERFCIGSREASGPWFERIGWMMEFDSPQGSIATFICNGEQLFDPTSNFGTTAVRLLGEFGIDDWQIHPFTDVFFMRKHYSFSCLNLPAGYYHMHTKNEYVKITDVDNTLKAASALIRALGCHNHPFVCKGISRQTLTEDFCHKVRPLTLVA